MQVLNATVVTVDMNLIPRSLLLEGRIFPREREGVGAPRKGVPGGPEKEGGGAWRPRSLERGGGGRGWTKKCSRVARTELDEDDTRTENPPVHTVQL